MLKTKKPLLVLSTTLLLILFSLPPALASETIADEIIHIRSDEVIDDDLLATGREVIIDGVVKGDLLATGQSVTVNGIVEGDLLAGAQAVTINGEVSDDVRVGAMVILIEGIVGDDVSAGVFSFESGPESSIGGDLRLGAFQGLVDGELAGDLGAGAGGLQISGAVGGNVEAELGEDTGGPSPATFMQNIPNIPPLPIVPLGLTLDENASVAGDLFYQSPSAGRVNEAAVAGRVAHSQVENRDRARAGFGSWLWNEIQRLLRLLLIGILAVWVAPVFVGTASQKLRERMWPSLGWGILTPIAFFIILMILGLLSLLIGFPTLVFGTLIFGYLLILFYLGAVVVGQTLGDWVFQRFSPDQADNAILTILVGLFGVWLLTIVPILGTIIGFFIALFGAGALWLAGREQLRGTGPAEPTLAT